MRRRTITLVVVGLVLALFVLPAAAQAVIGGEPVEEDPPYISYDYDQDSHVVFHGIVEQPEEGKDLLDCTIPEGASLTVTVDEVTGAVTVAGYVFPTGCEAMSIEGPNGQVNHGQFVSSMVHAYKANYSKDKYGPFGQFLKDIKQDKEIGKGLLQEKPDQVDDLATAELAADDADDDGDGPPAHANQNSKKPKKNK